MILRSLLNSPIRQLPNRVLRVLLRRVVLDIVSNDVRIWGDSTRVRLSPSCHMTNTLFNVISGDVYVDDYTFAGHNVSIITGTHDHSQVMERRMHAVPKTGRDVRIGKGVWLGSNAVVIGPCTVGDNAVVAAGAVVVEDVPAFGIVAGVPARLIGQVKDVSAQSIVQAKT